MARGGDHVTARRHPCLVRLAGRLVPVRPVVRSVLFHRAVPEDPDRLAARARREFRFLRASQYHRDRPFPRVDRDRLFLVCVIRER